MNRPFFSSMLGSLLLCAIANSGCLLRADTFTDPEAAGPIYRLQGEYRGVIDAWGGNWGAQVVAVSSNRLSVHLLNGGLPGDGFTGREPSKQIDLEAGSKELADGKSDEFSVEIKPDEMQIRDAEGKTLGKLTKIVRESKSMGKQPPLDGIVLFDGTNADKFQNGKLLEGGLLGSGCTSRDAFRDHLMHIEFRTPFQPDDSGQARGNSGVYVQGRYEVQVLDSFGLRGEDNECGGIYQIAKPKLNMCYPPLTWQTYDIDFTAAKYDESGTKVANARITVRHNGVLIHDDLELPRASPGKESENKGPGQLYLQDHGNPVAFRNIWIYERLESPRNGPKAKAGAIDPVQ